MAFASSVDLNKVISPVGQYIRSNPVPPIMRQIRPKNIKGLDDDLAAFERDEEMCKSSPPEKIETHKSLICLYSKIVISYLNSIPCCRDASISLPVSSLAFYPTPLN